MERLDGNGGVEDWAPIGWKDPELRAAPKTNGLASGLRDSALPLEGCDR